MLWSLRALCSNGMYVMLMWSTMAPYRAAATGTNNSKAAAAPEEAAAKPVKPRGCRKAPAQPVAGATAPGVPDEAHAAGDNDASVADAPAPTAKGRSSKGAGAGVGRRKKGSSKRAASGSKTATAEAGSGSLCGPPCGGAVHAAADDVLPDVASPMVGDLEADGSAALRSLASATPSTHLLAPLGSPPTAGSPADLPWPPADEAWCYQSSPAEECSASPQVLPGCLSSIPEQQPSLACSSACATGSSPEELCLGEPQDVRALERGGGEGRSGSDPDTVLLLSSGSDSEAGAPAAVPCSGVLPAGRGAHCTTHKRCR